MDIIILGIFLVATLVVGLNTGKQVNNLRDYALGGKRFSTITLAATIVATYSSGSFLFVCLENTYTDGLYYIIPSMALPVALWTNGQLVLRMGHLMEYVSVAEAVGSTYGLVAQVITGVSSILAKVGYIAVQFKAMAKILEILFKIDGQSATIIAAGIVIIYSASGGVKAVAFTDVLQLITFGIVIPLLTFVVWSHLHAPYKMVFTTLTTNSLFNPGRLGEINEKFWGMLGLLVYFCTPSLYVPSMFQRVAMARNVHQAHKAYNYAAWIFLLILFLTIGIGILLLAEHPGMDKEQIVPYLVQQHTYAGLRGLLGIGVMALAMSTADSSLNALSVILANDIVKPFSSKKEVPISLARTFSIIVGFFALALALFSKDILSVLLLSGSFYMPIYAVPVLLLILGFKTSERVALASMIAGALTALLLGITIKNANIIFPGMLVNLIVLLGGHYLLGEPGGWEKPDPDSPLYRERAIRREARLKYLQAVRNFSLYRYLESKFPEQDHVYFFFGLYAMATNYLAFYTIKPINLLAYQLVLKGTVPLLLLVITTFMALSLWPASPRKKRFTTIFWPLGISLTLFFSASLVIMVSQFQLLQLMVLILNFLVAVLLLPGLLVVPLALLGIILALSVFSLHYTIPITWDTVSFLQSGGFYGVILLGCLLIVVFRYQRYHNRLFRRNSVLQTQAQDYQTSLVERLSEKEEALAAFQHAGSGELLSIARSLQDLPIAAEGKEALTALQTKLLPIAFHLQGLDEKARDYLRLHITDMPLADWCHQVREEAIAKGATLNIHCHCATQVEEVRCDASRLTSLLVNSLLVLSTQAEDLEEKPTILLKVEDTQLSYPLSDVAPGYTKYIPALRITATISSSIPVIASSYSPVLNGSESDAPLPPLVDGRIIKSHYGYSAIKSDTFLYVIPVNVQEVRPADMDKAYMEVGAKPVRSDDQYRDASRGIDAQAQEAAFLKDVASKSAADMGMVRMALDTIKWYHGPKKRHSGEPFYLHPLTVAHIVLDYDQDESTIIGALLHDTVEDTPMQLSHVETMFGKDVSNVVDVVTHLQSTPGSIYKIKMSDAENLQMLDRTGEHRGLYVKLADRMHNMQTIGGHKKLSKQRAIAQETLDFFVPLARKMGLEEAAVAFERMCAEVLNQ